MLYSEKEIVGRIKGHIKKRGGGFPTWVVGTSKEPRAHMFKKHGVRKVGDCWILMHAENTSVARTARQYLLTKLDLSAAGGPDDPHADFVYAYRKSVHTKP